MIKIVLMMYAHTYHHLAVDTFTCIESQNTAGIFN